MKIDMDKLCKVIPELAEVPASQREGVWRSASRWARLRWQTWALLIPLAGLCALGGMLTAEALFGPGSAEAFLKPSSWGAGLGGGVGISIVSKVQIRTLRRYVRSDLYEFEIWPRQDKS